MKISVPAVALLIALAATPARAADHVLLIAGMGGEPRYSEEFVKDLDRVRTALIQKHGYVAKNIRLLGESVPGVILDASATFESVREEFERLRTGASATDTLLAILIGHGQSDYVEPKFNLRGPDLDAERLRGLVAALPMKDVRLVLSFPCSGHFSELLKEGDLSILAATDGPRQLFHCAMNAFVATAFEDEWSDQDGDGQLTFFELYEFLSGEVDNFYEAQQILQTENVSLEDNGDGRVTTASEGMDAGDGERSRTRRIAPAPGLDHLTNAGRK